MGTGKQAQRKCTAATTAASRWRKGTRAAAEKAPMKPEGLAHCTTPSPPHACTHARHSSPHVSPPVHLAVRVPRGATTLEGLCDVLPLVVLQQLRH